MDSIARSVILLMAIGSYLEAAEHDPLKVQFDEFFRKSKQGLIKNEVGFPNRRRTQLYSRNTGRFIQVMPKGRVVARGVDGNKFADLEILTVSFGKVHIKGLAVSLYICFDKRQRLIAKKRPTRRCIFREQHGEDAYTMYESEDINGRFIAFSRKGIHRYKAESKIGTKAVQFVERPRSEVIKKHLRYYTSRGRKEPIDSWTFGLHKMLAQKMGRWHPLHRENNSALNPLHDGKSTKKHRKNKVKKKHSSRKSNGKKPDEKQKEETRHDNARFPPRRRLRNEGKGSE